MNRPASATTCTDVPYCERCDCAMKLVRIVPKLGGLPQLNVYRCAECGSVKTVEFALH